MEFTGVSTTDPPAADAGASLIKASYKHEYKILENGVISIDSLPPGVVQIMI